jgi:hypothetical protein
MALELAEPLTSLFEELESVVIGIIDEESDLTGIKLTVKLAFREARLKMLEQLRVFSGREFCAELRESCFDQRSMRQTDTISSSRH